MIEQVVRLSEGFCPITIHDKLVSPSPRWCIKCGVYWEYSPGAFGIRLGITTYTSGRYVAIQSLEQFNGGADALLDLEATLVKANHKHE